MVASVNLLLRSYKADMAVAAKEYNSTYRRCTTMHTGDIIGQMNCKKEIQEQLYGSVTVKLYTVNTGINGPPTVAATLLFSLLMAE